MFLNKKLNNLHKEIYKIQEELYKQQRLLDYFGKCLNNIAELLDLDDGYCIDDIYSKIRLLKENK